MQVYRLFDMYDKDGDGSIDYSELTKLLEDEKPSWLQTASAQNIGDHSTPLARAWLP